VTWTSVVRISPNESLLVFSYPPSKASDPFFLTNLSGWQPVRKRQRLRKTFFFVQNPPLAEVREESRLFLRPPGQDESSFRSLPRPCQNATPPSMFRKLSPHPRGITSFPPSLSSFVPQLLSSDEVSPYAYLSPFFFPHLRTPSPCHILFPRVCLSTLSFPVWRRG